MSEREQGLQRCHSHGKEGSGGCAPGVLRIVEKPHLHGSQKQIRVPHSLCRNGSERGKKNVAWQLEEKMELREIERCFLEHRNPGEGRSMGRSWRGICHCRPQEDEKVVSAVRRVWWSAGWRREEKGRPRICRELAGSAKRGMVRELLKGPGSLKRSDGGQP